MPLAQTTYGPGGVQTDVSGASAGYGGGMPPEMGWMMDLAQRRARQQMQTTNLQNQMMAEQLKQQRRAGRRQVNNRPTLADQNRAHAENAAAIAMAQAQAAQARAISGRAPMRTSWIMGAGGHPEMDINAMTGAQRQVFLPQSASFTGPSLSEQDATRRQNSLEDMSRMQSNARGLIDRGGNITEYGGGMQNRVGLQGIRDWASMFGPQSGRGIQARGGAQPYSNEWQREQFGSNAT